MARILAVEHAAGRQNRQRGEGGENSEVADALRHGQSRLGVDSELYRAWRRY
jgi:hypothetical protein